MFKNRQDAGRQLAERLLADPVLQQIARNKLLVLSIPRGGVVVGVAVAEALGCVHDVIAVKKIGFPGHEELAIGAIAEDGLIVMDEHLTGSNWLTRKDIKTATDRARKQIEHQIEKFRQGRSLNVQRKSVILVDDGVATGETMLAAIEWLSSLPISRRADQVWIAVPVSSPHAAEGLVQLVDGFICLATPANFWAVGQFYREFYTVEDADVVRLLSTLSPEKSAVS